VAVVVKRKGESSSPTSQENRPKIKQRSGVDGETISFENPLYNEDGNDDERPSKELDIGDLYDETHTHYDDDHDLYDDLKFEYDSGEDGGYLDVSDANLDTDGVIDGDVNDMYEDI
jgi:hypothetical protein